MPRDIDAHSNTLAGILWNHPQAQPAIKRMVLAYIDSGIGDEEQAIDDLRTLLHWGTVVDSQITRDFAYNVGEAAGTKVTKRQNRDRSIQAAIDKLRQAQRQLDKANKVLGRK